MESVFDTTGVITKISDYSSIVSITINDVPKSFSFSKYLLYVFGLQCEGQMTNILDEGMEVNVRYKISNGNVPYIVAVWISEKPDHLCDDSALKPFYEQKGKVINVSDDNIRVQIDRSHYTVLISKEVFFRDGHRFKNGSAGIIGETVTFDAIPFESRHPTGDSYQATCAWIGRAPALVERFGLSILALDDPLDLEDPMPVIHGTVAGIPNEVVAFAEMESVQHQHNGKVLLFRSSFTIGSSNIKHVISVGDSLCMRIRFKYLFDGTKQLYAAQAWKDGSEVCLNEMPPDVNAIEVNVANVGKIKEDLMTRDGLIVDFGKKSDWISSQKAPPEKIMPTRRGKRRDREMKGIDAIQDFSGDPRSTREYSLESDLRRATLPAETGKTNQEKREILVNDPPLSGVISIISGDSAFILYDKLKIFVDRKNVFKNGKPLIDDADYMALGATRDQEVFFEAVERNKKDGFQYEATCVWIGKKPPLTFVRKGNTPEPGVEAKMYILPQSKTPSAVVKFDESSDMLIGDPPLSGPISLISKNTALISYQGLNVFVNWSNVYVDGEACAEKKFVLILTTEHREVNFEAVKLSPGRKNKLMSKGLNGFTHEATLAWFGGRPSMFFNARSPVLYRDDPPLQGVLDYDDFVKEQRSFDSVFIRFEGLKVFLDNDLTYYGGKPCSNQTILELASCSASIKFEAVKTSDLGKISYGYSHEATCAWIGPRPGLMTIIRTLPPMDFNLLQDKSRTYRGVVRKFCLPKVALICESQFKTTVSLHVGAFGCKPRQNFDYESGKDCISNFVRLNDIVQFKIYQIPQFANVLSATDVKVVNDSLKTSMLSDPKKSISPPEKPRDTNSVGWDSGKVGWDPYPVFKSSSRFEIQNQERSFQALSESRPFPEGSSSSEIMPIRDKPSEVWKGNILTEGCAVSHPIAERTSLLSRNFAVGVFALKEDKDDKSATGNHSVPLSQSERERIHEEASTSKEGAKEQTAHVPVKTEICREGIIKRVGDTYTSKIIYKGRPVEAKEHSSSEKVFSPMLHSFTLDNIQREYESQREVAQEELRNFLPRTSSRFQTRSPDNSKCLMQ